MEVFEETIGLWWFYLRFFTIYDWLNNNADGALIKDYRVITNNHLA